MTDITLTPAQFATLLDLLGTADTGEQEYQLTMNLTAKLLLLRMNGGGSPVTPPVASFTVLNDYATNVLKVNFTDTSTGTPTSWFWNFGDGNTSTSQNPTHTYAVAGHYDVTLTATNAGGSSAPVSVSVPVNAFEAALITAGFPRIYQYRETSGVTAANTGSDGILGVGAYVGSPVLGQADATGNPDAWGYDTIGQQVTLAAKTLTSCTIVALITALADAPTAGLLYGQNGTSQIVLNTFDGGAGSLNLAVDIGTGQKFVVSDPFMTPGNTYLLFARYDHTTGAMEVRYSDDGTIKTPSIAYDDSPVASPVALGNLTALYAGGGYDPLTGDVKMGATALISSILSDAALLPIAAAVFP